MSKLTKQQILTQLKHGLVASCQPVDNGPMDSPEIVAAMAAASVVGGAAALRIEGIQNIKAVRAVVDVPIVGIVKRDLDDSPVRITPFLQDIDDLYHAGADIIAVDGTNRPRPTTLEASIKRIQELGVISMADCSNFEEGKYCHSLGFDIIGSTMSGYTGGETPKDPDIQLVRDFVAQGYCVMAEGRYNTPELAAFAIENGAYAVTVGSALTRLEHIVSWFVNAISHRKGA